jgi:hypothetical protein
LKSDVTNLLIDLPTPHLQHNSHYANDTLLGYDNGLHQQQQHRKNTDSRSVDGQYYDNNTGTGSSPLFLNHSGRETPIDIFTLFRSSQNAL